jgi:hypothetical protein
MNTKKDDDGLSEIKTAIQSHSSRDLEDSIAKSMALARVNGPCLVYVPYGNGSSNNKRGTHYLDLEKTLANSTGWKKNEIEHYIKQNKIPAYH